MIKSWQHKGLEKVFTTGSKAGIKTEHAKRLRVILQFLDTAMKPEDMNLPGFRFHSMDGSLAGFYTVSVSGNWRLIFKFEGEDAILVDYLDYH